MLKTSHDNNQQIVDFHFCQIWIVLTLTWSRKSRQRGTTSREWKLKLNDLADLMMAVIGSDMLAMLVY